ncbi:M28 family metallopeptidase [Salirhabdus salicampi]|uniref:M28 family metallopeptidase n=1 Tax=Salirhabdus salicampi TaxID=476102 RepID=UPI0020C2F437|nr:M28 family metallopeptidase [Salirhabdus salicampi]MCP8615708.1 M28 family peptidase [Salirhabdus salicampi]
MAVATDHIVNKVDKKRLMEYTENISKEVRLSGTEEELRAFHYVQEKLTSYGLETELFFTDAYISLPGDSSLMINGESYESITHSMAVPTNDEGVTAEVVYAGSMTDAKFGDLTGKIALIDGLAIPGAVQKAEKAGAIAALFINAKYTHEMIVSPVWGNPTPDTKELLPNIPVLSVNYDDGQQIKQQVSENSTKAFLKTTVDTGWRKIPTLIADIKGRVEPEKFVLYSGHIDSWHYGVMDNGTANATMVEVARILSEHQNDLHRSVRFAFWSGHSHGRYAGSASYCDDNWEDLHENCVLHVNIDSVGAKNASIISEGNSMAEMVDLAKEVIESQTGECFEGSRYGRAGDQSFWGTGTPSLFMGLSEQPKSNDPASEAFSQLFGAGRGGGFGWWWHTTEDTLDKIDPNNLERDCKIYVEVLYKALTERILPINQVEGVREIKEVVLQYSEKYGDKFDLSLTVARLQELEHLTAKFHDVIKNVKNSSDEQLANETILELSRLLVPLNYVSGDLFDHDPAMKQSPVPSLNKITTLEDIELNSDLYFETITHLKRRVNRINYSLKQAIKTVENTLISIQKS